MCVYAFPQVGHERCAQNYPLFSETLECPESPDPRVDGMKPYLRRQVAGVSADRLPPFSPGEL